MTLVSPSNVVAAVRDYEGRYWVCRRTGAGAHGGLAGMWEYPGGKVEDGETPREALAREMREEFGVEIASGQLLDTIVVQEADGRRFAVHFYETTFLGEPTLRVHDEAAWLAPRELVAQSHLLAGAAFNRRLAGLPAETPASPSVGAQGDTVA